jgi:hypothetical protein
MPFYGGMSPAPRRYGGGIRGADTNAPLLQRVAESLSQQMGSAYEPSVLPPTSAVAMETHAYARAVVFDGWSANERLANQFLPSTSTVDGLLPRWERIMNAPPFAADTQPTRQARVGLAWARIGEPNSIQPVIDELSRALGPLYISVLHNDPSNALTFWPGGPQLAGYPWQSTIARLNVELAIPSGYANADGSPNALWWGTVGTVQQVLDPMLPSWMTFQWFIASIDHPGDIGFYWDEPDWDLEIFDS